MDGDVIGTLSSSMILFLVVTAAAYILLKHTKFGTYLYSIGSNEEATRLSGVNVDFNKIMSYATAVICVAFDRDGHAGKTGNRRTGGRSQL